ncbi:MAG: hypothetical protein ACOX30_09160 [Dethiobacteria bacterium]
MVENRYLYQVLRSRGWRAGYKRNGHRTKQLCRVDPGLHFRNGYPGSAAMKSWAEPCVSSVVSQTGGDRFAVLDSQGDSRPIAPR